MPSRIRDAEELRLGREPAKRTQKKRKQPPTGVRREAGGRAEKSVRLAEHRRELREQQQRIAVKERALAAVQAGSSSGQDRAFRARKPAPPIGPSLRAAGRLAFEAEKSWAKSLLRSIGDDPTALAGPAGIMQTRPMQELIVGPELTGAARGEVPDPVWAGVEAAGIVPFFKPLRALRAGRAAKAAPAATPDPAENLVRDALGPARSKRAAQQRGYREERTARAGKAQEAEAATGGGIEGFRAAKAALRGELPKVQFENLREGRLSQDDLDSMFRAVEKHPDLRFYEKVHARDALWKAFDEGRVPQKSQIKLLQTVFGQEAANEIARLTKAQKFGRHLGHAVNVPRSLMASFDLSAPFRQALVAGAGHPRIFARNFGPMLRAARSEKAFQGIMDDIAERPNADLYRESGLSLTKRADDLSSREEQFASNIAEKLPPVAASSRAYVGFLNKMRADVFDHLLDVARKEGHNVEDRKFLRGLAKYVNSATGRGGLGPAEDWAPALNALFFSPRLMASRINFLDPTWYMRLDPFARKQALKSMLRLSSAASVVLGLGAYSGVGSVSLDPRNADFAKLRVGNSRIDLLGGFQQYIRLIAQISSGKIVSSTTGKTMTLGPGFGEMNRWDILERFAASKFAPPPSFVRDFFKGTDFAGEPFEMKTAILRRLVPFIAQDMVEIYRETESIPATVGGAALIGFGVGVQTYSNPSEKEKQAETNKKNYTEWETKAKQHFKGEIPAVLVRAKRNEMLVKDARRRLAEERGYEKLSELTEQDELRALISVFLAQNPDVDPDPLMRLIQTASPVVALEAGKRARKLLGINLLDKYAGLKGKAELAEREKAFAGK